MPGGGLQQGATFMSGSTTENYISCGHVAGFHSAHVWPHVEWSPFHCVACLPAFRHISIRRTKINNAIYIYLLVDLAN